MMSNEMYQSTVLNEDEIQSFEVWDTVCPYLFSLYAQKLVQLSSKIYKKGYDLWMEYRSNSPTTDTNIFGELPFL